LKGFDGISTDAIADKTEIENRFSFVYLSTLFEGFSLGTLWASFLHYSQTTPNDVTYP
jgi:hypothetical protein